MTKFHRAPEKHVKMGWFIEKAPWKKWDSARACRVYVLKENDLLRDKDRVSMPLSYVCHRTSIPYCMTKDHCLAG